jgi:transposase
MSTSLLYHAFGITGVDYTKTEYIEGKVLFYAEVKERLFRCTNCCSRKVIKFGNKVRKIRLVPAGGKPVFLLLTNYRIKCKKCGQIRWISLPFVEGKSNCSNRFVRFMLGLCQKMTIKDTAEILGVGWDLVKDHHKRYLGRIYSKRNWKKLKYLGIDEFSVQKGHKYLTIALDLEALDIVFVNEGRSEETLVPLMQKLQKYGKSLKAFAIDMNPGYISALQEYLPKVKIVFDRFHIVRIAQAMMDELRRSLQNTMKAVEGNTLKGSRYLLLSNYTNLSEEKQHRLKELLRVNEPLTKAYMFKEQLNLLWDLPSKEEGERFLKAWAKDAWESGIALVKKLASSIMAHLTGVLNYFDHRITTAKVEGINNKIKTLKRQAYGFRDLEYFKLRLYHLHKQNYSLCG